MQIHLITGISGSGKSVALKAFEDSGYDCVDNLPVPLLENLITAMENEGREFVAVAIDARRKEIYWASYKSGERISGPSVNKPAEVEGFILDQYPDMQKLVELSKSQNISEPMYLRRPDAVPTAERT